MIPIQTLLQRLQERGFSLHLGDGRVQICGRNIPDEETKAIIHELREHREEVRQALASNGLKNGGDERKSKFEGSDIKARAEGGEIVRRTLAMLHGAQTLEQLSRADDPDIGKMDHRPQPVTPEALAASVLAESIPDDASSILTAWKEIFGIPLDRGRVVSHLEALREWQGRWKRLRMERGKS